MNLFSEVWVRYLIGKKTELEDLDEEYLFRNPTKIIRRLNRVRRMNGLLSDERQDRG